MNNISDWKDDNEGVIAVADAISRGEIGDNNPPDPIDEATAPYADFIEEAESWLDGNPVSDEGQMKAVDALTKQIKAALKDVKAGEESEAKPVYDQWKSIKAAWKPTIDDLTRISKGLVALVADYKKKLADEKRAAERAAWEAADKARREAEAKAANTVASDIEALREADAAKAAALEAVKAAQAAGKDTVKGMRKVTRHEITDMREALHWIARNDKDAVADFVTEYVRLNHKTASIDGVRVWQDREAF